MDDSNDPDALKGFIIRFVTLNIYIILIILFLCMVLIRFYT